MTDRAYGEREAEDAARGRTERDEEGKPYGSEGAEPEGAEPDAA
jgi:hypothetical protein